MLRNLLLVTVFVAMAMPVTAIAAPIRIKATTSSSGSAILELHANELVTMTPIPFRLFISDAAGQPLRGACVTCDMIMPSMTMPENRPRVTECDDAYGGELVFTCAMGAWRINCLAEKSDGTRQTMTFDIESVRMK